MFEIVAIGTSNGGLEVLKELAANLPGDFPGSIFIVQHTRLSEPEFAAGHSESSR